MAKRVIHSFNSGEVTPKLKGRTDFARYFNSCLTLKNHLLEQTGVADFRPGTEFIKEAKKSGVTASRVIPFVFNRDVAYILEFGEIYIRVFLGATTPALTFVTSSFESTTIDNAAAVEVAPLHVDIPVTAHLYGVGSKITIAGSTNYNATFTVQEGTTSNLVRVISAYTAETFGGTETIIAISPYLAANLAEIQFTQSADVMYIVDGRNKPRKLSRVTNTAWTLAEAPIKNGPFLTANLDETLTIAPGYPAWATSTNYPKNDIVFIAGSAINPPAADTTLDAAAAVDDGGGLVTIPIGSHDFTAGQSITLTGTANYDGTHVLKAGTVVGTSIQITATFNAETFSTGDTCFASAADKGGGLVGIPTTTNAFLVGARVTIASTTNYNASFELHNSSTTTEIVIIAPFVAEEFDGTETITETSFFKALTTHLSGGGNPTPPGNTTDWAPALTFTGTNLTLTASSALFDAGHVGALFKISHPRKDSAISGFFSGVNASEYIQVSKGTTWTFTVALLVEGTIELQRSYDDGVTSEIVRIYSSQGESAGRTVATSGEEIDGGALYRVAVTFANPFATTKVQFDFNIDEFITDGIVEITTFTNSTTVIATVIEALGNVIATDDWCEGAWSDFRGWPRAVSFYDNRLIYAGSEHLLTTVWASKSDDFDNFEAGSDDDQAFIRRLDGDQINQIQWISSLEDVIIGTAGGNWRMSSSDRANPMSPTNVTHRKQNSSGTDPVAPAIINNAFLYIAFRGVRLNELIFDEQIQGFATRDLNIISGQLLEGKTLVELAVMTEPLTIVFALRSDGVLLALSYKREEDQIGWSRIETDGLIKSIAVIPGTLEDELWMQVERTILPTATKNYIERKKPQDFGTDITGAWFVDSGNEIDLGAAVTITSVTKADPGVVTSTAHGLVTNDFVRIEGSLVMTELNAVWKVVKLDANTYTLKNPDTSTVIDTTLWGTHTASSGKGEKVLKIHTTGLSHLDGLTVAILVDGAPSASKIVSSGIVTTDEYSNRTIAGLAYEGELEPMPPDFEGGILTGRLKRISKVVIKFFDTVGGQIIRSNGVYEDIVFTDSDMILDKATEPKSIDFLHEFDGSWSRDERLVIKQVLPLPQKIGGIIYEVEGGGL